MSELHPQLVVDGPHRQGPDELKTVGLDVSRWLGAGQTVQSIIWSKLTDTTAGIDWTTQALPAPATVVSPTEVSQAIGMLAPNFPGLVLGHEYLLEIKLNVATYEKPVAQLVVECVRPPR